MIALLFALGFACLALPFFRPTEVPFIFLFVGRLHPLILHFPIVLIILALLFELAARYLKVNIGETTIKVLLIAAAISAFVSVAAGFFLFASGDYSGALMERHFWAGAVTAAGIFFTLGFFFCIERCLVFMRCTSAHWLPVTSPLRMQVISADP